MMAVAAFRELPDGKAVPTVSRDLVERPGYVVRHPEMAMLTKSQLLVGIDVEDGVPAEFKMCSLLHVASVEPLETATR